MIKRYCANCVFFDNRIGAEKNFGICRRYAPRPYLKMDGKNTNFVKWPFVDVDAFCGEFSANTELNFVAQDFSTKDENSNEEDF